MLLVSKKASLLWVCVTWEETLKWISPTILIFSIMTLIGKTWVKFFVLSHGQIRFPQMSITQQQSLSTQHNNNGRVPKLQATFVVVVSLAQKNYVRLGIRLARDFSWRRPFKIRFKKINEFMSTDRMSLRYIPPPPPPHCRSIPSTFSSKISGNLLTTTFRNETTVTLWKTPNDDLYRRLVLTRFCRTSDGDLIRGPEQSSVLVHFLRWLFFSWSKIFSFPFIKHAFSFNTVFNGFLKKKVMLLS